VTNSEWRPRLAATSVQRRFAGERRDVEIVQVVTIFRPAWSPRSRAATATLATPPNSHKYQKKKKKKKKKKKNSMYIVAM